MAKPPSDDPYREPETVIPVVEEQLVVGTRAVPKGGVRVHRRTRERTELLDMPLIKDKVEVRRVIIGKQVDGPLPVRREGDLTIVPVVEEELVLTRRFILKEEIHIIRETSEVRHQQEVSIHSQDVEVERVHPDGTTERLHAGPPEQSSPEPRRPRGPQPPPKRKSILG